VLTRDVIPYLGKSWQYESMLEEEMLSSNHVK